MTLYEWMEQERQAWALGQPLAREMQNDYFSVIEDLLTVLETLDFPTESFIIREEVKDEENNG